VKDLEEYQLQEQSNEAFLKNQKFKENI